MTRHSREGAVDERTFRRLVGACDRLDEPYRSECRFVLYTTGRLGLRSGELAHLDESWIDWDRKMIEMAQKYVKASGGMTQEALYDAFEAD